MFHQHFAEGAKQKVEKIGSEIQKAVNKKKQNPVFGRSLEDFADSDLIEGVPIPVYRATEFLCTGSNGALLPSWLHVASCGLMASSVSLFLSTLSSFYSLSLSAEFMVESGLFRIAAVQSEVKALKSYYNRGIWLRSLFRRFSGEWAAAISLFFLLSFQ